MSTGRNSAAPSLGASHDASPLSSPEVINARRTESIDAPHIIKLATQTTDTLFGRVNVVNIIEKAILAVTLSNENEEILGHAAFFDFPNLPDVDEAKWEDWMSQFYKTEKCTALNSLFMHYFVSQPEYSHGCAQEIIRTAFNAVPDLHFLFLAVPQGVFPESSIADVFKPLEKNDDYSGGPTNCAMFVCNRHVHVPVLHIRHARVEDHDDLTPIFNRHSDMLKDTYGNYFLAELIEAQDDNMQCLVAEVFLTSCHTPSSFQMLQLFGVLGTVTFLNGTPRTLLEQCAVCSR